MPKKNTVTKTPQRKRTPPAAVELSANIAALIKAGVMPKNLKLSKPERDALDGLTKSEIEAIVEIKTKMGTKFFKSHAAHAMYY